MNFWFCLKFFSFETKTFRTTRKDLEKNVILFTTFTHLPHPKLVFWSFFFQFHSLIEYSVEHAEYKLERFYFVKLKNLFRTPTRNDSSAERKLNKVFKGFSFVFDSFSFFHPHNLQSTRKSLAVDSRSRSEFLGFEILSEMRSLRSINSIKLFDSSTRFLWILFLFSFRFIQDDFDIQNLFVASPPNSPESSESDFSIVSTEYQCSNNFCCCFLGEFDFFVSLNDFLDGVEI